MVRVCVFSPRGPRTVTKALWNGLFSYTLPARCRVCSGVCSWLHIYKVWDNSLPHRSVPATSCLRPPGRCSLRATPAYVKWYHECIISLLTRGCALYTSLSGLHLFAIGFWPPFHLIRRPPFCAARPGQAWRAWRWRQTSPVPLWLLYGKTSGALVFIWCSCNARRLRTLMVTRCVLFLWCHITGCKCCVWHNVIHYVM